MLPTRTARTARMALAALAAAFLALACVQTPATRASIADTRPTISFRVASDPLFMRAVVDGLDLGPVSDYLDGGKDGPGRALKILPGAHVLRVERWGILIIEERLYVADGTSKVILVP
jgi:hypothetical protein